MAKAPGRNDPCPCGSGRKYKRCCLPADEASARAMEDLVADDEFDEDDLEPFVLDLAELTRVTYTHGFVDRLSDLRRGRGLEVAEWEAPDIPRRVLESIEGEEVSALEGTWGHPKAGHPIEVDVIDLETEDDAVSIEVFNRGLGLVDDGSPELRRIHRVCVALARAVEEGTQER